VKDENTVFRYSITFCPKIFKEGNEVLGRLDRNHFKFETRSLSERMLTSR